MILEGIVTTRNSDQTVNVAPMGPHVDPTLSNFTLKPFQSSRTYVNLKRTRSCVVHVVDDVELLARAAIGQLTPPPEYLQSGDGLDGMILADACRWYALRVSQIDDQPPRATMECHLVRQGRLRDFFGLNRAKHAVVEAAILATRLDFLPRDEILSDMARLQILVDKTGGVAEQRAFIRLREHVLGAADIDVPTTARQP